jgi:hypothetical protein
MVEKPRPITVVIESPYAGDVELNVAYAKLALADCLERGEAPFASHLLYTLVLDDATPAQRQAGMLAGFALGKRLEVCAVYVDLGITAGMRSGITRHTNNGLRIEERTIPGFREKLRTALAREDAGAA